MYLLYWTIELDKHSTVARAHHEHHQPRATVTASTNHRRCGRVPVCGRVCAEVSCVPLRCAWLFSFALRRLSVATSSVLRLSHDLRSSQDFFHRDVQRVSPVGLESQCVACWIGSTATANALIEY